MFVDLNDWRGKPVVVRVSCMVYPSLKSFSLDVFKGGVFYNSVCVLMSEQGFFSCDDKFCSAFLAGPGKPQCYHVKAGEKFLECEKK